MSEGLQVGLGVAVMVVYLVLTAWWLDRHWSEFELERDELRRASAELQIALGEALRPPLERLAREIARIGRDRDGLDR